MAEMSLRQYAAHRGVSLPSVQKAIKTGRISQLPNGLIESEGADREWAENTGPRYLGEEDGFGATQYTKARAVREHYQARLAKLEYEEKVGSLVSKDEVKIAAFNKGRILRDGMLNLADRIAPMVAAENDAARCHEIISTEVRKVLEEFADANG